MTDNLLMEDVRGGKVEKLAILFERHHVTLFNYFLRLTGNRPISEDLVQEVFTRILKYRTTYRGEDRFAVWMYKIARNAHIDFLRRQKETVPLEDQFDEAQSADLIPEERVERQQEAALISRALKRLSPRKQEVILLSRFQNLKYREIAELMECPVGTVKGMVHRAVQELGDIYKQLSREACRHEM
ncbi:MAG: RNA polymerase sigma factor [Candidatus Aminicenantes bacterium]|nr:RNA polymerase sigma factor [Candidatus Aminicenantes bacterium]